MCSSNLRQLKKIDEVCCYVWKNVENKEMFAKKFIKHKNYDSMFTSLFLHSFYIKRGKIYVVKINFETLLQSFVCMFTAKQQSSKVYLNHVCHNTLLLNLTQIPAQVISFEKTYPSYRRSICRYLFNIQIILQHADNSSICR